MIDHVGLQVADVDASVDFYVNVFAPVGLRVMMRFEGFAGLGDGQSPFLWFGPPNGPETRELHLALHAPDRAAVNAVHEAALTRDVEVLHAPREWPEYHPGYYAVFLRDPDGHNVEAVTHGG